MSAGRSPPANSKICGGSALGGITAGGSAAQGINAVCSVCILLILPDTHKPVLRLKEAALKQLRSGHRFIRTCAGTSSAVITGVSFCIDEDVVAEDASIRAED